MAQLRSSGGPHSKAASGGTFFPRRVSNAIRGCDAVVGIVGYIPKQSWSELVPAIRGAMPRHYFFVG